MGPPEELFDAGKIINSFNILPKSHIENVSPFINCYVQKSDSQHTFFPDVFCKGFV